MGGVASLFLNNEGIFKIIAITVIPTPLKSTAQLVFMKSNTLYIALEIVTSIDTPISEFTVLSPRYAALSGRAFTLVNHSIIHSNPFCHLGHLACGDLLQVSFNLHGIVKDADNLDDLVVA